MVNIWLLYGYYMVTIWLITIVPKHLETGIPLGNWVLSTRL